MPTLTVKDFSCIDHASVDLSRLTILIGPQGSGKSVISKLFFFFQSMLLGNVDTGQPIVSSSELKENIDDQFRRWFPESAWGNSRFCISYESGPISITITRDRPYKVQRSTFQIDFSKSLEKLLRDLQNTYRELVESFSAERSSIGRRIDFRISYQLSVHYASLLKTLLKDSYIEDQLFIPAGRSFFTSVGKAIAVFEHSNSLDPVTLDFGRTWASIRDTRYNDYSELLKSDANNNRMQSVFGGTITVEKDQEYILSDDGRKIPFSSLSSGQQELLPLWLGVESFFNVSSRDGSGALLYIEEPEAHLFPAAQSEIIEYLVNKVTSDKYKRNMFITTHSPYVLSKLNNLILAGKIFNEGKVSQGKLKRVLDKSSWISPGWVSAYAIDGRNVVSVIDSDGLIDAEYMDRISSDIFEEFSALVDLEAGQ